MKAHAALGLVLALTIALASANDGFTPPGEILGVDPLERTTPVSIVRHRWQVKIVESNQVAIRPGSVYDIVTYFEQNLGWPQPRFNYLFLDTGLGAADPIYPVFQRGYQGGWQQLLPAMWSEKNRHIDHASTLDSPEGCRIHSNYWVRHIDEFPGKFHAERAEGYTLVDISFNYYTKLRSDAECGRHIAYTPDPNFDAHRLVSEFDKSLSTLRAVPAPMLKRFEAKIGLLKLVDEEFAKNKWPRFRERYAFAKNSLWYYPQGASADFGLSATHPQPGLRHLSRPRHLQFDPDDLPADTFSLATVLPAADFMKLQQFLNGRPTPTFDATKEPGADTFSLDQVGAENYYTAGRKTLPMVSVRRDVGDRNNFELVSAIVRPYQQVGGEYPNTDVTVVPQVRFVYQLVEPKSREPLEQLFLHVNFDAVDRSAQATAQRQAHHEFLRRLDAVTALREASGAKLDSDVAALRRKHVAANFLREYSNTPSVRVSFSSSLTGIWVFGTMSRAYNTARELEPLRIVRQGIDVGYYSTVYDNVLFRAAAKTADAPRQAELEAHLDLLTPQAYRDPRRSDPHALTFEKMTCAQCHHMAGRDAVHVARNDGLDRRYDAPTRTTEFLYREFLRQLSVGPKLLAEKIARTASE